jgi:uncharacterized protein (DUF305 family)
MAAPGQMPDLSLDQLIELERRAAERAERTEQRGGDGGRPGDDDSGGDRDDHDDADGDVVLPWWQHPMNIVTLVVSSALIAAMIGWLVGDARSQPDYSAVDVGFLHDMRVHHEQAVYMSFVYRELPDTSIGTQVIAGSIIMGQSQDIGRMVQLLRSFGEPEAPDLQGQAMAWMGMSVPFDEMPGLASDDELEALSTSSGRDADLLFTELMIDHHEGGIHMAEFAAENADHPGGAGDGRVDGREPARRDRRAPRRARLTPTGPVRERVVHSSG